MACSCRNRGTNPDIPHEILPDEPCMFCAEKHFSAAMQLIHEAGYEAVNRQHIIGEIVLSQWHIYRLDRQLAERMRDIRHLIQNRLEAQVTEEMLAGICRGFDALIGARLKADAEANVEDIKK